MSRPTTPLPSSTNPLSSAPPAPQASPFRSTTAPSKDKKHHHHHHIHRHHHNRDKSVPQSAIVPSSTSFPFDSLLAPLTKATSRNEGAPDLSSLIKDERESRAKREGKERDAQGAGDGEKVGHGEEKAKMDKDTVKRGWELVQKRRAGRKGGEEALSTSLQSLSTLSTTTTRRLDYTYYSLLSHISALHSTLSSLSNLASTTSTLLSSFTAQSSALHTELSTQLHSHENKINTQASRLTALEKRMEEGKKRAEGLGQRMEKVRERIREQERREEAWTERVRRRLRMCWGMLAMGLLVCVVGLCVRHWPGVEKVDVVGTLEGRVGVVEDVEGVLPGWVSDNRTAGMDGDEAEEEGEQKREGAEGVMRMLDEL